MNDSHPHPDPNATDRSAAPTSDVVAQPIEETDFAAQLDALLQQIEEKEPGTVPPHALPGAAVPPQPPAPPLEAAALPSSGPVEDASEPAVDEPVPAAETVAVMADVDESEPDDAAAQASPLLHDGSTTSEPPRAEPATTEPSALDPVFVEPASEPIAEMAQTPDLEASDASEEDDLAQQIQALLDGGATDASAPAPPSDESLLPISDESTESAAAAVTDESSSLPEDEELEIANGFPAVEDPTGDATAAPAHDLEHLDDDDADATIRQLDEIIADEADEVMAGEFESIEQVLEPSEMAHPFVLPRQEASAEPATQAETEDFSAALTDAPPPCDVDSLEEEAPPTNEEAAPSPVPASPRQSRSKRLGGMISGRLQAAPTTVYRLLAVINRPLLRLSPELRSAVGYAALITAFNAMCLILYGVVL